MIHKKATKEISNKQYAIVSKFDDEEKVSIVTVKETIEECNKWFKTMLSHYEMYDTGKNKLRVYTKIGVLNYWVISLSCIDND